jgi:ankyrin repeat protein
MSRALRNLGLAATVTGLFSATAPAMAAKIDEALQIAVRNDDLALAKSALAKRANPNALSADNSSPLAWAVDRHNADMVALLLKAGAKANALGDARPLVLACENGSNAIITQLLNAKADVNAAGPGGVTAFHLCASRATASNLERMIAAGASLEVQDEKGLTPLMFAAASGNVENIILLAQHHANVNTAAKSGFSPLFFAAKSKNVKAVEALLRAGANVGYAAPDGTTALQLALLNSDTSISTMLVQSGAPLNTWDINGKQALHVAVANGQVALAKLMISKGADLNGLTRYAYRIDPVTDRRRAGARSTPAAAPASQVNALAAQRITDQRGGGGGGGGQAPRDPFYYDMTSKVGYQPKIVLGQLDWAGSVADPAPPTTPLMVAAAAGQADAMKLLIEAGANKEFALEDGTNMVLAAVASGNLAAVKYALSISPSIKVTKKDGTSVMHLAVAVANRGVAEAKTSIADAKVLIQYLADNGADLTAKNARGQTPADTAGRADPEIQEFYGKLLKARGTQAVEDKLKPASPS